MLEGIILILLILIVLCKYLQAYFRVPTYQCAAQSVFDYDFQTGDLILCQYGSPFLSAFTTSSFQHTGLIFRHPKTNQLFLWHMCAPFHDLFGTGRNRKGLRLEPLFRALHETRKCAVRRLVYNGTEDYKSKMSSEWMTTTMQTTNFNPKIFLNALSRRLFAFLQAPGPAQKEEQSCVEITTRTYVRMGVLQPRSLRMNILPEDYWDTHDKILPFQTGFSLSPAVPLIKPRQ